MNISIPKGTRDFSPVEMQRRNYIFDTIKAVFRLHCFEAIETPALENLSTLLGKYGEEGDKLIFKILNSGNFLSSVKEEDKNSENLLSQKISEKGLRYDLTVPFARYVVQHRNEITFPFKRYQIQPVWRADKPQKGRYREFYQCDADVIGSNSLLNELELINIIDEVYKKFNINITIKFNNRKLLSGIAEVTGEADKLTLITAAIDKLDKIGVENVIKELQEKMISQKAIDEMIPLLKLKGSNRDKLSAMRDYLKASEIGMKGIAETETLLDYMDNQSYKANIDFDIVLARGLNYYTGTIIEVKANDVSIGSITGGGRYDDLTGVFGLKNVSGVGISFGADRIYDVLNELKAFPEDNMTSTKVLIINFNKSSEISGLKILDELHKNNINAEIYPVSDKLGKQFQYANNKNIAFVLIQGDDELKENKITVKNMQTGSQEKVELNELIQKLGR